MFVLVMSWGSEFWGEMPFPPSLVHVLNSVVTTDGDLSHLPETVSVGLSPGKVLLPLSPLIVPL